MGILTAHVQEVIFAGNQFFQPFSHAPTWLEELIERGVIFKEDGWCYILPGEFVGQPFKSGDRIKLIEKHESSYRHRFEVIRYV